MKSFKTRILVWTLSIVLVVLVAFVFTIDRSYRSLQMKHIDEGLRTLAPARFHPTDQKRFWIRFEDRISEEALRILNTNVLLVVYGNDSGMETLWLGGERDGLLEQLPVPRGELRPNHRSDRMPDFDEMPPPRVGGSRGGPRGLREAIEVEPIFLNVAIDGEKWRFVLYELVGYNVAMGVDLRDATRSSAELRKAFLIALPLALAVLGLGSWLFARRAIKPITKLTSVAGSVTASDLSVRIESAGEDQEFGELIAVFNDMLDRLSRSFEQARRFSADAAHELKTPLTILQGQLEDAIQSAPDGSDMQVALGSLIEETHRLKSITRKLLLLAQADTGKLPINRVSTNFLGLVEDAFESLAEDGGTGGLQWGRRESFEVNCDQSLVSQILRNLASNAAKYRMGKDSPIRLDLFSESGNAILVVSNRCEAIGWEQRESLFDRFSRIDSVRNRSADGTGLGLSLSREFARAHGGDLFLEEFDDETEIGFRLEIPK